MVVRFQFTFFKLKLGNFKLSSYCSILIPYTFSKNFRPISQSHQMLFKNVYIWWFSKILEVFHELSQYFTVAWFFGQNFMVLHVSKINLPEKPHLDHIWNFQLSASARFLYGMTINSFEIFLQIIFLMIYWWIYLDTRGLRPLSSLTGGPTPVGAATRPLLNRFAIIFYWINGLKWIYPSVNFAYFMLGTMLLIYSLKWCFVSI
jgi:hypothetical protein